MDNESQNAFDRMADKLEGGFTICNVRFSKQVDKLIPALVKARKNFDHVCMDGKVTVKTSGGSGFSFKYATLAEIISAVDPALLNEGLLLTQHARTSDRHVIVTTIVMHESGQYMASEYQVPVKNIADPKEVGGATTYGRRYSMSPILCVAADEDTDAAGTFDGQVEHEQKPRPLQHRSEIRPPARDNIHWQNLMIQLSNAGVSLDYKYQIVADDKPLAREMVFYCTGGKVTLEAAYKDPRKCEEAVMRVADGNREFPNGSDNSLLSQVKEQLAEKSAASSAT